MTFTWWIDEPVLKGSANPTDEDLADLRAQGFAIAVSLVEEDKQPPRYKRRAALSTGWTIYSIPIPENQAPSIEQIHEFMARLSDALDRAKIVVFCQSGKGRTACMGAFTGLRRVFRRAMRSPASARHAERPIGQLKNGSGFSLNTSGR